MRMCMCAQSFITGSRRVSRNMHVQSMHAKKATSCPQRLPRGVTPMEHWCSDLFMKWWRLPIMLLVLSPLSHTNLINGHKSSSDSQKSNWCFAFWPWRHHDWLWLIDGQMNTLLIPSGVIQSHSHLNRSHTAYKKQHKQDYKIKWHSPIHTRTAESTMQADSQLIRSN